MHVGPKHNHHRFDFLPVDAHGAVVHERSPFRPRGILSKIIHLRAREGVHCVMSGLPTGVWVSKQERHAIQAV